MRFDTIVSNPPYVRILEKELMSPNVIEHEPNIALFVKDEDPLLFYRKIAQLSNIHLKPEGVLYFEINEYLSVEMKKMLTKEGFKNIEIRKDNFKKDRMIKCIKNEKIY
jgi:release factor glutamine methyltransferase